MSGLMRSWLASANNPDTPFPLNNLPYGVFSIDSDQQRCGVALGEMVLDLAAIEQAAILQFDGTLQSQNWNDFMALGTSAWQSLRETLTEILSENSGAKDQLAPYLHELKAVTLHLPISVTEFTDFYASKHHATNVGTMFRGPENGLPPNWLHMPIGYNGRASSVVVSGTEIRRPWGQLKGPNDEVPHFGPSQRFDIELEMGAIVGRASSGPLSLEEADANIFGYVLLNDWSARDIQAWEYQPLGPFQSKATATSISPWIVTSASLEPFRCKAPRRAKQLLPYLDDEGPMLFDIDLSVKLSTSGAVAESIAQTNYCEMYYSSAQQLAHHTSSGCSMRVGDLLGSGTISGPLQENRGSLLEQTWGGQQPIELSSGEVRSFLEDGDEVILEGAARGDGFTVGFGSCKGRVLPALKDPYKRD